MLARADLFPDALTGTSLAIQMGGPLLLTSSNSLDFQVRTELRRILPPGATVYLTGGVSALRPAVAEAVRQLGFTPVRLGGSDRYATAVAIATAISGTRPRAVLLATGTNFPDALTAAVATGQERYSRRGTAAQAGGVVLLTNGAAMPTATGTYLKTLDRTATALYLVGGPAATAFDQTRQTWPGAERLVGADRFDTAVLVAGSVMYGDTPPWAHYSTVAMATGFDFPDAMSGGALIGSQGGPLLLAATNGLTPTEAALLRSGHVRDVVIVGGQAAVSDQVLAATADTAFSPNPWLIAVNRIAPPLP